MNHDVKILCSDLISYDFPIKIENNFLEKIEIHREKAYKLLPLPSHLGYFSLGMLKFVLENSFDIVHSHSYGSFAITVCSLVKYTRKIKHVVTTHSEPGRKTLMKNLFDFSYSRLFLVCDAIIALTNLEKNHLIKLGISEKKIYVIPNGIDTHFYSKKREIKFKELINSNYILYAGSLDVSIKGVDVLIKAFYLLRKKINNVKLVIAAIPTKESFEVAKLIRELKLEKDVKILFYLDSESIASLLKHCNFFVLPSRTESFGISILESFASGKTVVASNVGGIPEIVKNGNNGLLFQVGNYEDLFEKMLFLLKNEEFKKRLENNALAVSLNYDWKIISKKVVEVYESVLCS